MNYEEQQQREIKALYEEKEEFSYCIGKPYNKNVENSAINVYAYGCDVHYGNLGDATEFKEFIENKTGEDYYIYKLVKIE